MARAGILYSSVAHAAAKLAAEGKNPTVDSVREALGDTGSKSTIAPMLKRWKAAHQETVLESEAGVPAELLHAVKNLYEKVQTDVQQQLTQARTEHQLALQAVTDQLNHCQTDNRGMRETKAALSADLAQTTDALTSLQAEFHRINLTTAALQSDNSGLQHRLADRAVEIVALNQQLMQSRSQFEHYQDATAAQRKQERQAGEQRIAHLENALAGAQQHLMAQQATVAQLSHLSAENVRLVDESRSAQEAFGSLRSERDQLGHQVNGLTATNQELVKRLDAAQQVLTEARMALAVREKEVQLLTRHLYEADEKIEQLEQERLSLTRERAELQAHVTNQGSAAQR